ncbi:sensor histidine kinase [Paenibacillus sp. H1-7]|uniref:sensor histidine kinase n=1 Tax=Paenibacillus sp. H1-7 TaxID=2282849 RepID=UPI001EF7EC2C|nr:HAMP domain-containing sensor histidine kinase [Paenibacillus sp. H1-7]ULL19288.1 sensor histidine kinase [Paenibacillus sp. H1-7]
MTRISLRWKFTGFIAALLLFTVGWLTVLVLRGVADYQQAQTESALEQQLRAADTYVTQLLVTGTRVDPGEVMRLQGQKLAVELGTTSGMRTVVYDALGNPVGDSLPLAAKRDVTEALGHALNNKVAYITEGDAMDYLGPLQGPEGQVGVVHFQASLQAQHAFYRNLLGLFLICGAVVMGIGFVWGWLYMNRQANAIGLLKAAADRIGQGEHPAEPVLRRKDELGELGRGIYSMSESIRSHLEALKEEQGKLSGSLAKVQALEQQQKHFINNISHEFKTPLTSIKAYADLLQMYDDDPRLIRDASEAITKESSRLYELVDKVLQLAALNTYEFDYHPQQVDLKGLLEDIVSRIRGKAEKFHVRLDLELHPVSIWADKEQMVHIVMNLIDNAIKYNVAGGNVTVTSRIAGDQAEIEIADTGVGIPQESLERVFEPFYTVNKDRARQSGGSGLGLTLVRQWVERQEGRIRIGSAEAEGQGTVVTISFPLHNPVT